MSVAGSRAKKPATVPEFVKVGMLISTVMI